MIQIITDSASDIPHDVVLSKNIDILPVVITHNDKSFREFYDITPEDYYQLLLESEEIPKTSQVSIECFTECFTKHKERGCTHLLYISLNSNGSGTFQAGNIARDMFYEKYSDDMKIEIIDSASYSYIYGRVAVACADKALENVAFDEIISFAKEELASGEALLGVFELKFLKKSGRISGGTAFVGEALGLKPISIIANGGVNVCDKVRGDRNLCKKLVEKTIENCNKPEEQTAFIVHGLCDEGNLSFIEDMLLNTAKFKKVERLLLGAAITTNTGPRAVAIFYKK